MVAEVSGAPKESTSALTERYKDGQKRTTLDQKIMGISPSDMARAARAGYDAQIEKCDDKMDIEEKRLEALGTLSERTAKLQDLADSARGLNAAKGKDDVFRARTGAMMTNDGSDYRNYAAFTSKDESPLRAFRLTIEQVATQDSVKSSFSQRLTSKTTAITFPDGNLIINGHAAALTDGMTLEGVRDAINAQVGASANITASIVEGTEVTVVLGVPTAQTVYRLDLSPTEGNSRITLSDNQGESLMQTLGIARNEYTPFGASGTFTINGVSVDVTSDMTLYDIRNAINGMSNMPVKAAIDTPTNGDRRLVLLANDTGSPIQLVNTLGTPLTTLGLANSTKTTSDLAAKFTVDGVSMQRSTNVVEDFIEGAKLQFISPTSPGQYLTASVEPALQKIADGVTNFVTQLQAIQDFYFEQTKKNPDGTPAEEAVLNNNQFFKSFMSDIQDILQSSMAGLTGEDGLTSAQDIGIAFKEAEGDDFRYKLQLDTKTLYAAIEADPEKVRSLLTFSFSSSKNDLRMLNSPTMLDPQFQGKDIALSVYKVTENGSPVTKAKFTVEGKDYTAVINTTTRNITGEASGSFENVSLYIPQSMIDGAVLDGAGTSRTFSVTQGLFDRVGNYLADALKTTANLENADLSDLGGLALSQRTELDEKAALDLKKTRLLEKAQQAYEKVMESFDRIRALIEQLEAISSQISMFTSMMSGSAGPR